VAAVKAATMIGSASHIAALKVMILMMTAAHHVAALPPHSKADI